MSDSNVQIEEVYKRVPFFPTNWEDYNKCPVCNSVLKNGKKMAKIYSNGELIEEDVLLPLKICQTCDIGYGTPELIEYIHTVYRKMHINPMQLRKNDIGNGNVNDIKLRIQMQNSFHNKHKSKNGQYPEVDKLLGIIQKRKDKQIKGSLSKYMGISNVEKNTIHKKNEEYNVIPTDAQIYVGNSEQHVCLGKMTGSVRLTNRVLACKGKIYPCNIKQCLRCKKYFISPRDFYSNSSLPDNYTYIEPANKVVSISPHDFIVRVNTNRCTSGGHRLKDIKCSVPLGLFSGGVRRVEVPAAYCYVCDKYYILDEDYEMLKKKGVVLCHIDEKEELVKDYGYDDCDFELNKESLLHKIGYNVSATDNLLCSKRWYILESAVDFEILTREEICSHLDYLIHRSKGRLHYEDAISKWECDRTHIANYRSNELETIKAESISTKRRI